ncbi:MAG: Imm61 family immunity protein [Actinomycetota bacterium]
MIPISQELVTWAAVGGFDFDPEDQSGAAVFSSDPGAEIRMYVRQAHDGYVLTWAERRSAEQFELFTPALETMERYLFGQFGSNFRSLNGLERLRIPTRPEAIAHGYSLSGIDDKGRCTLFHERSDVVAVAGGDITAFSALVKLSHLLSSSVDEITASYRDAEGRPLFPR